MSNQVSWQSAFWALVPIALNSMCQPCGKILGLPSKYGFYLASSPILCVANAFELAFKLLWRSYSMRSIKGAASLTANEIFEDVESSDHRNGLAQLQEIWQVRAVVFACGAMPQVIKLYAMTEIPWTKACASLYLDSFFAIEIIMIWLKCYRSSLPLKRQGSHRSQIDLCEFFRTFVFFITISFSSVAIVGTVYKPMAKSESSYAGMLVHWACVGLILKPLFYHGTSSPRPIMILHHPRVYTSTPVAQGSLFYCLFLGYAIFGGLVWATPGNWATIRDFDKPLIELFQDWEKGPGDTLFFPLHPIYLLVLLFFCFTHLLATRRSFRAGPTTQFWASMAFMLLHLLAAILLYVFRYDPQGTYKPDWSNNLG